MAYLKAVIFCILVGPLYAQAIEISCIKTILNSARGFNGEVYSHAKARFKGLSFEQGSQRLLEDLKPKGMASLAPEMVMGFFDAHNTGFHFGAEMETLPDIKFKTRRSYFGGTEKLQNQFGWKIRKTRGLLSFLIKIRVPRIAPKNELELKQYAWQLANTLYQIRFTKSILPRTSFRNTWGGYSLPLKMPPGSRRSILEGTDIYPVDMNPVVKLAGELAGRAVYNNPILASERLAEAQALSQLSLYRLGGFLKEGDPEFQKILFEKWVREGEREQTWLRRAGILDPVDEDPDLNEADFNSALNKPIQFRRGWYKENKPRILRNLYFANVFRSLLIYFSVGSTVSFIQDDGIARLETLGLTALGLSEEALIIYMNTRSTPENEAKAAAKLKALGHEPATAIESIDPESEEALEGLGGEINVIAVTQLQVELWSRINALNELECLPPLPLTPREKNVINEERKQLLAKYAESVKNNGGINFVDPQFIQQAMTCSVP